MTRLMHRIHNPLRALAAVALFAVGVGCAPSPVVQLVAYPPPFIPVEPVRETIVPKSQFMEVAVLNFVDQTGAAGPLVETLADRLTTAMHKSGRFEVYDRGQLRSYDFTQVVDRCQKSSRSSCGHPAAGNAADKPAAGPVVRKGLGRCAAGVYPLRTTQAKAAFDAIRAETDAFVLCAITAVAEASVDMDCRLINSRSFTVMVAMSAPVTVKTDMRKGRPAVSSTRATIDQVAVAFKKALPTPNMDNLGTVLVQDGPVLTISLGRKDGIIPGMNVFVVGPGRIYGRGKNNTPNLIDEAHLAQAYVVAVYDNTSQVVVYEGNDYRVEDGVRFK